LGAKLTNVEEARQRILDNVNRLSDEMITIADALGRVIDEDIKATVSIPHFDNSAMDGYALRTEDTKGACEHSAMVLNVLGDVAAGYVPDREINAGEAIRIMTGAPIPKGADAVLMQEYTERFDSGTKVKIFREVKLNDHIRRAGEDIKAGDIAIESGTRLNPAAIGMLAAMGKTSIKVVKRPTVAIISTGDELVNIDEQLAPGKIRNSNAYSISALVAEAGCIPLILGIAHDNRKELVEMIEKGLEADMIITTGGVSVGDYDIVKDVVNEMGEMILWKINMKPGKPLAFGTIKGKPLIGLPGNPTSSMVSFIQFARPALLKMSAQNSYSLMRVEAEFEDKVKNKSGRRNYIRVMVRNEDGVFKARLSGGQHSGSLKPMNQANGLMVVPENIYEVNRGDKVKVELLEMVSG
jgi:molybdopterin molybdotransferase